MSKETVILYCPHTLTSYYGNHLIVPTQYVNLKWTRDNETMGSSIIHMNVYEGISVGPDMNAGSVEDKSGVGTVGVGPDEYEYIWV